MASNSNKNSTDMRVMLASATQTRKKSASTKKSIKRNRTTSRKSNTVHAKVAAPVEQRVVEEPVTTAPVQIVLRPMSAEDRTWLLQTTREEMSNVFRENYGYELNLDNVLQYVHASQTRMIVADGKLAGYVSTVVDDDGRMNIGSLILSGPFQRKGFGTRIMRQIEQEAHTMGLSELEVFVQSTNQGSLNFLRRFGFQEVPSMQPQTIIMIKSLQAS